LPDSRAVVPKRVIRYLPLTSEGLIWLVAVAALLVTGLLKGINLITLLSCLMLPFVALNWRLARRQLKGLHAQRLLVEPVFAGSPFTLVLKVHNDNRKRRFGVGFRDQGPAHDLSWFLPLLGPGETAIIQEQVVLPRRGRYTWGALVGVSAYPLGLAVRQRTLLPQQELIVLPQLGRLHRGRLREFLNLASPTLGQRSLLPRRHPAAHNEFHGLRLFRSGDSPRLIHWRTSARRGELMIREFEDTPTDNLIVVVDPHVESESATASLDLLIRLAATVCWEWCRQKGDRFVLVVAGDEPAVLSGITSQDFAIRMLERLAVEKGAADCNRSVLLEQLAGTELPVGSVLLLTTRADQMAATINQVWHRPVACLSVRDAALDDFFEP
jgi:uncharacterized protein (DUF58 family)